MKIVLLGAGKLAWHIGPALQQIGVDLIQIYSRRLENAEALSDRIGSTPCEQINQINTKADLYILAVADQAIVTVAEQLNTQIGLEKPIVHTSGATPVTVFQGLAQSYGVFYPLQSFSKGSAVDFTKVPFCIDANNSVLKEKLLKLAQQLSPLVYELDDEQRAQLHLAAVFANNFVNHLIGISQELLDKADIPKDILQNIIRTTIVKLEHREAKAIQTGPAIRKDWETLKRHQALLEKEPRLLEVYKKLSEHIVETTKPKT